MTEPRDTVARWLMNNTANRRHDQWVTYEAEDAADELLGLLGPGEDTHTVETLRALVRTHPTDAVPTIPLADLARIIGEDQP
jgi:hypothetical protein